MVRLLILLQVSVHIHSLLFSFIGNWSRCPSLGNQWLRAKQWMGSRFPAGHSQLKPARSLRATNDRPFWSSLCRDEFLVDHVLSPAWFHRSGRPFATGEAFRTIRPAHRGNVKQSSRRWSVAFEAIYDKCTGFLKEQQCTYSKICNSRQIFFVAALGMGL